MKTSLSRKKILAAVRLAQLNRAYMISEMLLKVCPQARKESKEFPRVMKRGLLHGIKEECTRVLQESLSLPPKVKRDICEDQINKYQSALQKFAVEEWSLYCSAVEVNIRAQADELGYFPPVSKQSDQICKTPDMSSNKICRTDLQKDPTIDKDLPRLLKQTSKDVEETKTLIQSFAFAILRQDSKAAQMIWDCVENKRELVRGPRIFLPPHIPKSIAPPMEYRMPDDRSFEEIFDDICKTALNHRCIDFLHYIWATDNIEAQRALEKICTKPLDRYSDTETIIFAIGQNMIPLAEKAIKNCAIDRTVVMYTGPRKSDPESDSMFGDLARPARTTSEFRADRPLLFAAYYGNCDTLKHFFRKALDLYDDDDNYESEYGKVLKDIYCPYIRWIRHRAAKHLIDANADFRIRDWHGRNLIHLVLKHVSKALNPDESSLAKLLRLIPNNARQEMFTEKSYTRTGLFTPLSYWIANLKAKDRRPQFGYKVLRVLVSLGAEGSFGLYNGYGQSPLHQAVKAAFPSLVEALIENDKEFSTLILFVTIVRPSSQREKKYGYFGMLFAPGPYVNTTSNLIIWEHASVKRQEQT
ncbi:MAG: hypothetical protein Q9210_002362 [Variospora velana]